MNRIIYSYLISGALVTNVAFAQEEIPIPKFIEGQAKPIWLSVSGINGEALQVLQFDLYVQGFNFTSPDEAQYLISGSANGNFQGRATDKYNKSTLVSHAYSGESLRRQVHQFVDDFVSALQRKPIARTKIA